MPSIENAVVRVVVDVRNKLAPQLADRLRPPTPLFPRREIEELLDELGTGAAALTRYLDSPEFAAVVTQLQFRTGIGEAARDQLYQGLRLAGLTDPRLLDRTADLLHRVVFIACDSVRAVAGMHTNKVDGGDLLAAGAENSRMLTRLRSLTEIHEFAAHLRGQVAALHDRIRLPHIGVSRSVPYDRLYVQPHLDPPAVRLGVPGDRTVILGDPGAGKSTLAAKFACDVASDGSGRVPFLLVLREFAGPFAEGGRDLVGYLEMVSLAPYNVQPPRDAVEYLLRTGRAVVILDGMDELVRTELRRRITGLVEGFAHRYPLVPIVVTARKVGYDEAPLSEELFTLAHIQEFDHDQVREYARRWFALDEATSPADRTRLATSFIEDSERIPKLRSNPLLLTLLCALYSSDRYLPNNLAQVYERCALLLFEQWDTKRGIDLPLSFEGRLRGAVQHLAWRMFTAAASGRALSRTRIVRMLTEYLEAKLDDYDESVATAERFLAFCTGRSWILTDVGATEAEPQYGFTHRTFLEYFAAEDLVRTHRTAPEIWKALRPNISQWDVVAQIALQLYERNFEGGADELLTEALGKDGLVFAARALHHVTPSKRTIRKIATAAVDSSALFPVRQRLRNAKQLQSVDTPLTRCLFHSSAANRPVVEQVVADRLSELIGQGEFGAAVVLDVAHVSSGVSERSWRAVKRELTSLHRAQLTELWKEAPWTAGDFVTSEPGLLAEVVRRHGVGPLYAELYYAGGFCFSLANLALRRGTLEPVDSDLVAKAMTEIPLPWGERPDIGQGWNNWYGQNTGAFQIMMALPMLESSLAPDERRQLPVDWLNDAIPAEVQSFLRRWERGEFSVLADPRP